MSRRFNWILKHETHDWVLRNNDSTIVSWSNLKHHRCLSLVIQTSIKSWSLHFLFSKDFIVSWRALYSRSSINEVTQCSKWNCNEFVRLWLRRESVFNFNVCVEIFLSFNNQFRHHDRSLMSSRWATTTWLESYKTFENWRSWSYSSFSQFSFASHQRQREDEFFIKNVKWVEKLYSFWLDYLLRIDKCSMSIMSRSISTTSLSLLTSRTLKSCKRFSFKYEFFVRFEFLLTMCLKINDEKTIVSCECFDFEIKRFFSQCIVFLDVVHDVCENCIWQHRDVECSHSEYVAFVESTSSSSRQLESRMIIKSKNVEIVNSTIYLSMRNNRTSMTTSSIISIFAISLSMMIASFVAFVVVASFVVSIATKDQNIESFFDFDEETFVSLEFFVSRSRNVSTINFAHVIWQRN